MGGRGIELPDTTARLHFAVVVLDKLLDHIARVDIHFDVPIRFEATVRLILCRIEGLRSVGGLPALWYGHQDPALV